MFYLVKFLLTILILGGVYLTQAFPALALPPAGFEKIKVVGGLKDPTSFRFAPNGDIYIALQAGEIKILRGGVLLPTPVITLNADSFSEKGLLGMELDPNFATNGYIYVSYTSLADGFARISRITVVNDIADPSSEVMFGHSNQTADIFHNANDIKVGPDNKIWWLIGDNLQPANSQSLSNVHGKVHRFDMDLSSANDNPWHGQSGKGITDSIYALGLRNPFRMAFLPTGKAVVGDVGSNQWEEINTIEPGANYGWPLYEGDCGSCGFANPTFTYARGTGAAVTGMTIYNGVTFPPQYQGVLFYGDYAKGFIRYLVFDEFYQSVLSDNEFDPDAGTAVDLHVGPDGNLYYLGIFEQILWKITPVAGNRTPTAQASADPIAGLIPLNVTFSSAGSSDPDGTPLTFNWDFGDTTSSTEANPIHTYNTNGTYNVILTVSDGEKTAQANLSITVGNELPTATIDTPVDGTKYNTGDVINYSGTGVDPEDGILPDSAFSWTVIFHHATHIHPFIPEVIGVKSGNFTIPVNAAQEADTWYEIKLTLTDSIGLKKTVKREIFPNSAQVTVQSNIPGTQFSVNGKLYTSTFTEAWVVGAPIGVSALSPQFIGDIKYRFQNWSDGGVLTHSINVPAVDTTYTVNYAIVNPPPAPWQTIDIGPPAILGNTDYITADQSFVVEGAGWDIWDITDQFHYTYQPLNGNGEVIVRITSLTNTDLFTKAGVMIKQSASAFSPYAMVAVTPGNGSVFQYNFNGSQGGLAYSMPAWLKLVREGNKFTSSISADGINWTLIGTKTFEMDVQTTVGLFVTSHHGAKLAMAGFDNVTVNDIVDPPNTPPTALNQVIFTPQDNSVDVILTANDPDAGRLNYSLVLQPASGIVSGTAPQFTYTPNPGFVGNDSFSFKANDGFADSNEATVSATITTAVESLPAPWANLDIGTPLASGSAQFAGGIFFVKGGGDDIWQGVTPDIKVDQFHYVNQPFSGDGEIVARVSSQTYTDEWGKAGVMIKDSATPGSPYIMMATTPGNGFAFQSDFTSDIHGVPYSLPNGWVKLQRIGNTFIGYHSPDGINWTQIGSKTVSIANNALAGLFVTSHNGSVTSRVTFDNVSVNGVASNPLPAPWKSTDVGSPQIQGSTNFANGAFVVSGAGIDTWQSNDQFQYSYQPFSADGDIIARITSQTNTDPFAKAGIMIKESTTPFSPYAFLTVTPANGVLFQYNFNGEVSGGPYTFPLWLKLNRTGNIFTAYTSSDGLTWTQLGSTTMTMSQNAIMGMAVTSHNENVLGTAVFDNVSVPQDIVAPTVVITSPTQGSAVANVVNISAQADDLLGVTKVEFYVDDILLLTDDTAPFEASWDTTGAATGPHTILAKAYDAAGNIGVSEPITVNVESAIEVFSDSFEVNIPVFGGNWTQDAQADWFQSTQRSVEGAQSAEVDGIANNSQLISNAINLQGRTQATITFSWLIEPTIDLGEYLAFDISTDGGVTWVEKAKLQGDIDAENFWHEKKVEVSGITNLKLRFRGLMSDSVEDADVDYVKVIAGILPPPPTTLFEDSFEVTIPPFGGLWTQDVQADWFQSLQRSTEATSSAEVDGLATDATLTSVPINLQGNNSASITFSWLIEPTLDLGEYLAFDVSTNGGVTWVEKAKLQGDIDLENSWHQVNVDLINITSLQIRFRATMSDGAEDADVDMVRIRGKTIAAPPGNVAPIAQNQNVGGSEDTPIPVTLQATDQDSQTLNYIVVTQPTAGTLSGAAPNLTYTPNPNFNGADLFTFKANDNFLDSNIATVSINVAAVNDPPVISSTALTVAQPNLLYTYDVQAQDVDGDILTYSLITAPLGMTINSSSGLIQWTPTDTQVGDHPVSVVVSDGTIGTTQNFTITVSPLLNTPVEVFSDSFEVNIPAFGGKWTQDVQNDWFQSTQRAVNGSQSAEVDGLATDAQLISNNIDLQGRSQATITFSWLIESSLDLGEYLAFDVSTDGGTTWVEKAKLNGDVDTENVWHDVSIQVSGSNNIKMRFRGNMSDGVEDADVDNVKVVAGVLPPPPPTLFSDSFENGAWNGLWTADVQNDWFTSTQRAVNGLFSAEVDGPATDATITSIPINLQGFSNVNIAYSWFIESSLDLGEYLAFDVSTDGGITWVEKAKLQGDIDTENVWHSQSINLNGISSLKIRFRASMSDGIEDADVDLVKVVSQ